MESKSRFFRFALSLSLCAVVVEMSSRHHRFDQRFAAPLFEADDNLDSTTKVATDDADSALEDAKESTEEEEDRTTEEEEDRTTKEEEDRTTKEEEDRTTEEEEDRTTKEEEEEEDRTTKEEEEEVGEIVPTVSKITESKEVNSWATHCFSKWKQYPCKLGFRHGCKNSICWSQCNAAWRWNLFSAEWCWVRQPKSTNVTETSDDNNWEYLTCKTNADCTDQFAYRRKCHGPCSLGKF